MDSKAYSPSPVLRRPQYTANTSSTRLFNHSYPPKSVPINVTELNSPYPPYQPFYVQPTGQSTYPTSYQTSYHPSINYALPQPQIQSPYGQPNPPTPSYYYQVNPNTLFNSPVLSGSGISISSKGLEAILIAILILVALDLVVIRPHKLP